VNFCWPIAVTMQPRPTGIPAMFDQSGHGRAAWLAAWLVSVTLALGACASHPPHPVPEPPAKPAAPVAPTAPKPAPAHETPSQSGKGREEKKAVPKPEPSKSPVEALAPAEVGYYMDVLQGRLKQAGGKGLVVERGGDRINVALLHVEFEADSDQLNAAVRDGLTPVARVLAEFRMIQVSILLHTTATSDDAGQDARRAQAVLQYLTTAGVAARRILVPAVAGESPMSPVQLQLALEPIVAEPAGQP
jgi:outer membrane protein OmpA-like peptidoglycan-associated protein